MSRELSTSNGEPSAIAALGRPASAEPANALEHCRKPLIAFGLREIGFVSHFLLVVERDAGRWVPPS